MPRTLRKRRLVALDTDGKALFMVLVSNKEQGRMAIMNHALRYAVTSVEYNNQNVPIGEVYRKWPITEGGR